MPSSGPNIQPIVFDPDFPFRIPLNIDDYEVEEDLLKKVRKCHAGLKRVVLSVRKLKAKRGGGEKMGDEAVGGFGLPHPRLGVVSELPAERIAAIIVAVGAKYAVDHDRECSFKITFYGVPAEGADREPRAYSKLHWNGAEFGLPDGDAEADEEGEDEDENEEGEGGEDEDGEDEEEDEGEDEEEDDDWAAGANPADPHAPPGMRHERGVQAYPHLNESEFHNAFPPPAQPGYPAGGQRPGAHGPGPNGRPMPPGHGMQQGPPMQPGQVPGMGYEQAFPPGGAPAYPAPHAMGQMTDPQMGMGQYRQEMHPATAMFMHHLGGVFAETRASMREMRQDVRESRAATRNAEARVLSMSNLSTSHYENMARASQTGWNALHQGMSMQLNTLQNAMAWERKINELETKNEMDRRDAAAKTQGGGALETILGLAPLLMGGVGQVMHYVKGREGEPPPLLPPEMLQQMMGGGPPGGPPPGMAPPGMGPPPPPHGFPGQAPPPPPPPQAGPPPGPTPHPGPAQPGPTPGVPSSRQPYQAGAPPMPNAHSPFVGHPSAPNEAEVIGSPPPGETITVQATPQGEPPPPGAPPAPETVAGMVPGPTGWGAPNTVAQPAAAPAQHWSPHPQAPQPQAPARPDDASPDQITADEVRQRFARAPLACMCDTLVKTTSPLDASRFAEKEGDIWALLQEAGAGETDMAVQGVLGRLRDALDAPGRFGQLLGSVSKEHGSLLTDIRRSIASMSVTTQQPSSPQTWVSPLESVQPGPQPADPTVQPIPGTPPPPTAQSPGEWVMAQSPPDFSDAPAFPAMPDLPVAPPFDELPRTGDPVLDGALEISVVPTEAKPSSAREPNRAKKSRRKKRDSAKAARKKNRGQ